MCFGGDPPPPVLPAPPPPPPPVLEQPAPESAAPTDVDSQNNASMGVKKYRSSGLAIGNTSATPSTSNNSGLGISM